MTDCLEQGIIYIGLDGEERELVALSRSKAIYRLVKHGAKIGENKSKTGQALFGVDRKTSRIDDVISVSREEFNLWQVSCYGD